jgi:hypothetical protein
MVAKWHAEFEADGERQVHDTARLYGPATYPLPKRLFALEWLRGQGEARKDQEERKRRLVRAFGVAMVTVIVGIIGVAMTWLIAAAPVTPRASSIKPPVVADRTASPQDAAAWRIEHGASEALQGQGGSWN